MKHMGTVLALSVAVGNVLVAGAMFRLAEFVQYALVTPLDANLPATLFFVHFWWWPLIVATLVASAAVIRPLRARNEFFTTLIAIILAVEVAMILLHLTVFVAYLSAQIPTPAMIKRGVLY
jgi:hypothetical protein